ncbi:MAG: YqjD family protein [Xanthobacteraceae bacterium]|jgi:ElaB/YqjD/DUF883 family membrane-anchored ribosome-binding protein|nr:DUF883 domain-containing protein [Pseudolabrys sp.]
MATSTTPASNGSNTKEAIDREVETLKDDIARLTQQVASLVSTTGNAAYRRARKNLDGVMANASDKGQEAVDAVKDVTQTIGDAVEDAVYKRPVTTLAMAAGIGFLIGAIWRR